MALIISDEVTGWRSCQRAKRGIKISIRQGTYGWIPDSQHPAIRSWVTKDGCHKWEVASSKPSGRITAYARDGPRWFRPDGNPEVIHMGEKQVARTARRGESASFPWP